MTLLQWAKENGLTIRIDYTKSTFLDPDGRETLAENHRATVIANVQIVGSTAFEVVSMYGDTREQALAELSVCISHGRARTPEGVFIQIPSFTS